MDARNKTSQTVILSVTDHSSELTVEDGVYDAVLAAVVFVYFPRLSPIVVSSVVLRLKVTREGLAGKVCV